MLLSRIVFFVSISFYHPVFIFLLWKTSKTYCPPHPRQKLMYKCQKICFIHPAWLWCWETVVFEAAAVLRASGGRCGGRRLAIPPSPFTAHWQYYCGGRPASLQETACSLTAAILHNDNNNNTPASVFAHTLCLLFFSLDCCKKNCPSCANLNFFLQNPFNLQIFAFWNMSQMFLYKCAHFLNKSLHIFVKTSSSTLSFLHTFNICRPGSHWVHLAPLGSTWVHLG